MWPDLPLEFNVVGTPVSSQTQNPNARDEWKAKVLAAARGVIEGGSWAFEDISLMVTLFYFPQAPMAGDVDNIVKFVLDALIPNVYLDDGLVDRVVVQRFSPSGGFSFVNPSETLVAAMESEEPVLYVRVSETPLEGIAA